VSGYTHSDRAQPPVSGSDHAAAGEGRHCRRATRPTTASTLTALALHCTTQEDQAAKVERQVRKSAAALFLQSRIGERFHAIVTGASDKGTWVRTLGTPVEGGS
jgi:exoribonuclease R